MKNKKKEFRPIAMRCTQEQFYKIKPKLEGIGEIGILNKAFSLYEYLTNNYNQEKNTFDFIGSDIFWASEHRNNIHETWNESLFLEACGIKPEFKDNRILTVEFIKENADKTLREVFPDVCKVGLQLNKWYKWKGNNPTIGFVDRKTSINNCYGFSYTIKGKCKGSDYNSLHCDNLEPMTDSEVTEALTKEAVRRGYKEGVFIISFCVNCDGYTMNDCKLELSEEFYNCEDVKSDKTALRMGGCYIYSNGIWAEIIPTMTKEEAYEKFGVKIV